MSPSRRTVRDRPAALRLIDGVGATGGTLPAVDPSTHHIPDTGRRPDTVHLRSPEQPYRETRSPGFTAGVTDTAACGRRREASVTRIGRR
jgi:hypothetical protein